MNDSRLKRADLAWRSPDLCLLAALLTSCALTSTALGQAHSDIEFSYVEGKIVVEPPAGESLLLFASEFPTSPSIEQQTTTLPGFASEVDVGLGLGAGDEIVYDVLDSLFYWNAMGFAAPAEGTQIRVRNNPPPPTTPDTIIDADSGLQSGSFDPPRNRIGAADSGGDFHVDLQWNLEPNNFPVAPPPPEFGAYGVKLRLATSAVGIEPSDPLLLVFNFGLDSATFEMAQAAFAELLLPSVPGDYNDDGTVDAADYTVWQDHLGRTAPLPNDPLGGAIGRTQYDQWRDNFSAGSSGGLLLRSVPEPGSGVQLGAALVGWLLAFRRRTGFFHAGGVRRGDALVTGSRPPPG